MNLTWKSSTPKNWAAGLGTLLLGLSLLTACSSEPAAVHASPEIVRDALVFTAQPSTVPDLMEAVGTVRALQTSDLASQVMGNIVEIRVHEGDRVRRGQILAVLDDAQSRAAVDRAQAAENAAREEVSAANADFKLAEATFKRYQALYDRKSVSPQEFDEMQARFQAAQARRDMSQAGEAQAKAALQQARTTLAYTRILAPFDGVVTARKAEVGTLASPGIPILTVEDVRRYRLEVPVNETDLRYLRQGQATTVLIDALGDHQVSGRVAEIVPAADPASRSFLVKIDLPSKPSLRSGLFGRAEFARGKHSSLLIPKTALIDRGQLQGVYVLDGKGIAGLRYITVGKPFGGQVEVLAGLQAGEMLVANPGARELSGKKIEGQASR